MTALIIIGGLLVLVALILLTRGGRRPAREAFDELQALYPRVDALEAYVAERRQIAYLRGELDQPDDAAAFNRHVAEALDMVGGPSELELAIEAELDAELATVHKLRRS